METLISQYKCDSCGKICVGNLPSNFQEWFGNFTVIIKPHLDVTWASWEYDKFHICSNCEIPEWLPRDLSKTKHSDYKKYKIEFIGFDSYDERPQKWLEKYDR
jgi:hypothetical protein